MYKQNHKLLILAATMAFYVLSFGAKADVALPALDIAMFGGDTGVSSDGTTLTMDATAFSIFTGGLPPFTDIPDADFSLTATYGSFDGGITYTFINGSLSAGSYMSATFDTLTVLNLGGTANFLADLSYTGGSLVTGLAGGTIEGAFVVTSGNLAQAFTGDTILAKAGSVVPVPAAVWLFGSGLLGLVGVARRKKI
jgi:hypothetical protein